MGLTQRELADRSGYTESYISRVEPLHSDKYPTLDYVFRMAQVLGVPPYLLFVRERDLDAYRAQEEPPAQAGSRGGPDRAQGRRSFWRLYQILSLSTRSAEPASLGK